MGSGSSSGHGHPAGATSLVRGRLRLLRLAHFVVLTAAALLLLALPPAAGASVPAFSRAAATSVTSPGISAPPDVIVGEADGYVDLPVSLSAPGSSPVSVAYATANSTAVSSTGCPTTTWA